MIVHSFYSYKYSKNRAEELDPEDLTIPDQSLTVREILENFSRGSLLPPPIETGDDEDFDDYERSYDDLADAFEDRRSFSESAKAKIQANNDSLKTDSVEPKQSNGETETSENDSLA